FPRLFAIDTFQDCKVSGRWFLDNDIWRGRWAWRIPFRGRALDDLSALISVIGNLSLSNGIDKWAWMGGPYRSCKVIILSSSIQDKLLADNRIGSHHIWNS
ncbi:hypothetical protein Tco_0240106, partial [Tanacetum coccineum]